MAEVRLRHVTKFFGDVAAVDDVNVEVQDHELVAFVGASGCGKTTTLRMIAGLERISSGEIWIQDRMVNDLDPAARNVAMVFQNFALYPHMTAFENIAFPLSARRRSASEKRKKVEEVARLLQLSDLLGRSPRELSGGQQQRVALGRAVVRDPTVLLMDEPLSNLDAKLRVQMRTELKRLQRTLGTTTIYVTHDQTEAMTMGDRIAVMDGGVLQQFDTPYKVYYEPVNRVVAGFVGSPPMGFVDGRLLEEDGNLWVECADTRFPLRPEQRAILNGSNSARVVVGVRPEHLSTSSSSLPHLGDFTCLVREPLGSETLLMLRSAKGVELMVREPSEGDKETEEGELVPIYVNPNRVHVFDPDSGQRRC